MTMIDFVSCALITVSDVNRVGGVVDLENGNKLCCSVQVMALCGLLVDLYEHWEHVYKHILCSHTTIRVIIQLTTRP